LALTVRISPADHCADLDPDRAAIDDAPDASEPGSGIEHRERASGEAEIRFVGSHRAVDDDQPLQTRASDTDASPGQENAIGIRGGRDDRQARFV